MKLILPLSVVLHRKTKPDKIWILNLNRYRNENPFTLNAAKVAWTEVVRAALAQSRNDLVGQSPLFFQYTIFPNSNRKFDLGNVCSIIQKFTDDALITFGIIKDDSYKEISKITYLFGGVDKENPRAELFISIDFSKLPF
jgi:hypothetical protein